MVLVIDEWMSVENWSNDADRRKLKSWVINLAYLETTIVAELVNLYFNVRNLQPHHSMYGTVHVCCTPEAHLCAEEHSTGTIVSQKKTI